MDRPILFSAPMVRALLAGTKTQTRRTAGLPSIEQQPNGRWHIHNRYAGEIGVAEENICEVAASYAAIKPDDRLWVKENGWERPERTEQMMRNGADTWEPFYYDADLDEQDHADLKAWGFKRRPSIHLRRVYSRLTLHVTDVRVQRLHDMSDDDIRAEGIVDTETSWLHAWHQLWARINGEASWDANPWVAAYTFTVERANIDQARPAA